MRILRDPTPVDGGGTANPPAPAPVQPPAPQSQPAVPQTVQIPLAELQTLLSLPAKLAEFEARQRQQEREAQEKVTQAQIKQGQAEEAVKGVQARLEAERDAERANRVQVETTSKAYARDTALSLALAGHGKVRPAAIPQLMQLLKDGLETTVEDGTFVVRTPANSPAPYKSPADYVSGILANPDYAHFLLPGQGGGMANPGGQQTLPTPPTTVNPRSYQEQIVADFQAKMAARQSSPYASFGLGKGNPVNPN